MKTFEDLNERQKNIVLQAIEIEKESVKDADALAYVHRMLAVVSFPYKNLKDQTYYEKVNGFYKLSINARPGTGLPYGNLSRLIHIYLASEIRRTGSQTIYLGNNLTDFMKRIGIDYIKGGKNGSITRLRNQMERMFRSDVILEESHIEDFKESGRIGVRETQIEKRLNFADELHILWSKVPGQQAIWDSHIKLNKDFVDDTRAHSIPLDMRMVAALKSSPLEIDILMWLSYKMFSIKRPVRIPFTALELQFGSNFKHTYTFTFHFRKALKNVQLVWQDLKLDEYKGGIIVKPSKLPVPKLPK